MKFTPKVKVNPRIASLEDLVKLNRRDMDFLTKEVDKEFRKNERSLFASEGASGGSQWPALSPAYAAWKAKKYPGRKIMTRKGKLRRSLTVKDNPEHISRYVLAPRATITVGTRNRVAAYHIRPQAGLPNPLYNPRMPNRDTLQSTRAQDTKIHRRVQKYLAEVKLGRVRRVLEAWPG